MEKPSTRLGVLSRRSNGNRYRLAESSELHSGAHRGSVYGTVRAPRDGRRGRERCLLQAPWGTLHRASAGSKLMQQNRKMTESITFEPFPPTPSLRGSKKCAVSYIDERVSAGDSLAEAETSARQCVDRSAVPRCRASTWTARRTLGGIGVAHRLLWIGLAGSDPERWWGLDVKVEEQFRGQGYGRQPMCLLKPWLG
jgi:hypothetical protein